MGWKKENTRFINPYNFISIAKRCNRDTKILEDIKKDNLLTGYIECIITTKTPIFIPNTTSDKAFKTDGCEEHKSYDFFSYETLDTNKKYGDNYYEPVIPGSSLRGMIRSAYEAVTNSCMLVIDNKKILYKRLPDPGKPGIIVRESGKILLYEAEKCMLKYKNYSHDSVKQFDISRYHEGDAVYIRKNGKYISDIDIKPNKNKEFIKGNILKGEDFGNRKHYVSVMIKGNPVIDLGDEHLDDLKKIISLYQDKTINKTKGHNGYSDYKKSLNEFIRGDRKELPVFYKINTNKYYLSPACITKEVYKNTIEKILQDNGGFNPCKNIDKLCETCSLFGMVGEEQYNEDYPNAVSSRIRFTDARVYDTDNIKKYFHDVLTLKELSSPKISATEFYLKKFENAQMWTYDFAFNWGKYDRKFISKYKPQLRGRKIYFHSTTGNASTDKINERNVTIRPVKANVQFKFRIYFEGIKKEQLKRLIWVLNIGNNGVNNDGYHKLGMAKSLGLGTVKISVNTVKIRNIELRDKNICYEYVDFCNNTDYEYNWKQVFNNYPEKPLREFIKATKLNIANGIPITYPLGETKGVRASYQWFVGNKSVKGNGTKPVIEDSLPEILEDDISLCKYKK